MSTIEDLQIRDSLPGDEAAIEALYRAAFPAEDLRQLVRDLLTLDPPVISLVATVEEAISGHIVFTHCDIAGRYG